MATESPEPYVDASRAAEFLSIRRRRILEMARAGLIPAHPLGSGARKTWRFRLTELANSVAENQKEEVFTSRAVRAKTKTAVSRSTSAKESR
jgi:hypothetical protein